MTTHKRGEGYVKKLGNGRPTTLTPSTLDMLPPLPAVVAEPSPPVARAEDGKIADSDAAKELGRRGGLAKAQKKKLMTELGLARLADNAEFTPYYKHAQSWFEAMTESLASQSDGYLGPAPMSLLQLAAAALAVAKFATDKTFADANLAFAGLIKNMGDFQRQNILAATDLARREAESRRAAKKDEPFFDPFAVEEGEGT